MTQDAILEPLADPPYVEQTAPDLVIATGEPRRGAAGRPRAEIDQTTVVKLARLHCTQVEIAEWFGVTESVIRRRFGDLIRQCYAETRARLRQEQIRQALAGNTTMLIFLGKVLLGQREDQGTDRAQPLPWSDQDAA